VDIHPAAKIGRGIMLDHATGIFAEWLLYFR
jgi:serine acetyltransferase